MAGQGGCLRIHGRVYAGQPYRGYYSGMGTEPTEITDSNQKSDRDLLLEIHAHLAHIRAVLAPVEHLVPAFASTRRLLGRRQPPAP